MKRSDINNKYKWDLSKMYKNTKELETDEKKIKELVKKIVKLKNMIMDNSNNLLNTLNLYYNINRLTEKLYVYAKMDFDTDTKDNNKITLIGKYEKLIAKINESIFFVFLEILKSDIKVINKYIKENEYLKLYEPLLKEQFRFKKHILSDKEEELLSHMSEILSSNSNTYESLLNSSFKFKSFKVDNKTYELTTTNFIDYLRNKNRDIRKNAFNNYYLLFDQYKESLANTFKYNVKNKWFISNTRKYKSPLEKSLFNNDLNIKIYDNLINKVNSRLDLLHKYVALKKDKLKLDEFHFYDLYIDMLDNKDNKKYTYEEGVKIIKNNLKSLGDNYLEKLDYIFNNAIIDVYPSESKRSGAYSFGMFDSDPYILLNYDDSLDSVMTLAHEVGHSIHSLYQNENNPYIYANYPIFLAETASIVNEIILAKNIIDTSLNNEVKKEILDELMDKFRATLYRQTHFAEFEKIIYEKENQDEVLTADLISNIYLDLTKKYYGKDIIYDDYIKLEWMRIPHFYTPFYVYQYATGISIASFIASKILNKDKKFIDKYINFLKSGSDKKVIDIISELKIDINESDYIDNAFDIFDWAMEEFKKIGDVNE